MTTTLCARARSACGLLEAGQVQLKIVVCVHAETAQATESVAYVQMRGIMYGRFALTFAVAARVEALQFSRPPLVMWSAGSETKTPALSPVNSMQF